MKTIIILFASLLLMYSCNNEVDITNPVVDPSNFIGQTNPLPNSSKLVMEGIYDVVQGKELLGDSVAVKWNKDRLSIFSGKNGGYLVLNGGYLDSVIFFAGYWRYATSTETGVASFFIPSDEGGAEIISADTAATTIRFVGEYGIDNGLADKTLVLEFKRDFSQAVKQSNFYILAHRGGGRNSDYLGVSENSIPMINLAERFGATGIEVDARLSKDGIPFIYHDSDINLRLCQKSLIWGDVKNFTMIQLKTLITLRNGEKIPTLEEALEFVLEETTIRAVWLDTKDADVIPAAIAIQHEILQRSVTMGRDLNIFIGIPDEDVFERFNAQPGYQEVPSLCELSPDVVRQANSRVWAPRWTLGIQTAEVQQMHAEGRLVFTWTLDETMYIEKFIKEGDFDGILTNYPTIVSFYHYIR